MSLLETIERLCEVVRLQADIIEKQTEALEQAKIVEKVAAELAAMRKEAEDKREPIEKDFY